MPHEARTIELFAKKANVRVLEVDLPDFSTPAGVRGNPWDLKRIGGGLLVQTPDTRIVRDEELKTVTRLRPDASGATYVFSSKSKAEWSIVAELPFTYATMAGSTSA